jgi:hypothetical protein
MNRPNFSELVATFKGGSSKNEAQLNAYKDMIKNIYNGSKVDQKMHVEDTESPSEIFFYQEISMFWNKRSM